MAPGMEYDVTIYIGPKNRRMAGIQASDVRFHALNGFEYDEFMLGVI